MTRKKKIVIALGVIFLLLLLFFLFWFLSRQKKSAASVVTPPVVQEQVPVTKPRNTEEKALPLYLNTEQTSSEISLQNLAQTFTERYGSYSNESDFANLYDVLDLMSATFRAETEQTIATAQVPDHYYGITTHVLSVKMDLMDETGGTAKATVNTQREEATESIQNVQVRYQYLSLLFVKEQGIWKVDGAAWE